MEVSGNPYTIKLELKSNFTGKISLVSALFRRGWVQAEDLGGARPVNGSLEGGMWNGFLKHV